MFQIAVKAVLTDLYNLIPVLQGVPMNTKNLSTVTTDVIESYGNTAKNVIHAYRLGNQRVARFVDQRWESAVQQTASRLRVDARKNALAAQRTVSGMYVKGIDVTSAGADRVVDKFVEIAGKGVHQVAYNAKAFEKRTGVTTLNTIAKAAVPAVVVVSDLAGKLEQGSSRLANTVGGKKAKVKLAAIKRAATRKAASTSATVKKASTNAARKAASAAKSRKAKSATSAVAQMADAVSQVSDDISTAVTDTIAKVNKQVAKRTAPARKSAPRKSRKTA